ncbi:unnamed protein product [Bemisia tabaci]|uniref:(S)-2-hydroxy-acid oxidase n=1 Tax=Bemisia tabaci TaxID=7038 RepID=A0A9P0CF14_BEMTA|nr:unnamed protein product [Bemisia tabaci]
MASKESYIPHFNHLCNIQDFEESALQILPKKVKGYYKSGACNETTLANNISAFQRLRIRPRVMIDVSVRQLETKILGNRISFPLGIAPTAMQKMAHHDGEIGTARAAGEMGTIFILSTLSTTSVEDVAAAAPNTIKWLQLYIYKDRDITRRLVERADKAGFKALVLTVDTPKFGIRYADAKNQFDIPAHLKLANFSDEKSYMNMKGGQGNSALSSYVNALFDPTLSWKDVQWLKSITKLPIVLKGILTREDAKIAADLGVAAILVSNHGARQLDTTPASIEALPEISEAVGERVEVYLDGGIRNGTDVFKALALGAKMVFVGRPAIWGLTNGGKDGVKRVLEILKSEFDNALALAGALSVEDIQKSMVVHESHYAKL